MKKNYSKTILVALFIFAINFGYTQVNKLVIKGSVADSVTKQKISFASLHLINSNNEKIKATVSNERGDFDFANIPQGQYSIEFSTIGYTSKIIFVNANDTNTTTFNLNIVYLLTASTSLKEVTVTAKKVLIKREIDRISYNIQADPESKVLNVLDLMKKVPYLSVDGDNNILVKGNGSFRIFIDGKPSGLVENNPKEFLKTIPAATIQRIEVITNPSAKYDAEGLAGIINIVFNKKINNGYTGSINFNQGFPTAGSGTGSSFSLKQGKLGITAFAGGNINAVPNADYSNTQTDTKTLFQQNGNKNTDNKSYYVGTELSYELDTFHLIAANISNWGSKFNSNYNLYSKLFNETVLNLMFDAKNVGFGNNKGVDASINYQISFRANKKRLLTFSYRYMDYENSQNNNVELSNKLNISSPNYKQNNLSYNNEKTIQIDFVTPYKKLFFETGIKAIFRNNNSDFNFYTFNTFSNKYENDITKSDIFNNNQNIYAAYTSCMFSIKDWNFQTGVRMEQTNLDVNFLSSNTTEQQNYFNLIPTLGLQKQINESSSINAGFNQRIKRPGINRLNPFIDRSNLNFISSGNPNLNAVLNNEIQIGYSLNKKLTLNVGMSYSFSNNIDLRVSTYDSVAKTNYTTYKNTGRASRLGIDFSMNYSKIKNGELNMNGNVGYFFIQGFADNRLINNNLFAYYVSTSGSFNLNHGWQISVSANVNSSNPTGLQGVANAFVSTSFSCNKELIKNKLTMSAYINNPFSTFRTNETKISSFNFNQTSSYQEFFRSFGFSLNYKFGKMNSEIKKNRREISNNDVAN